VLCLKRTFCLSQFNFLQARPRTDYLSDFRTGSSSEEGASESDEDSTTSFEEGSYDGREGDIIYQCRDDEAIAQGLPGAKMYDQNIRET